MTTHLAAGGAVGFCAGEALSPDVVVLREVCPGTAAIDELLTL
ncbi:hypothetical protein [Lentzea sp. E54]